MKNALLIQKLESAVVFVAATYLYLYFGFSIWQFFLFLLVFDVSIIGYFFNPRIGAVLYNIGHSFMWPVMLLTVYIIKGGDICLAISLLWFAHVGMDRALGYGLKSASGFMHTHLGDIGKKVGSHPTPNSLLKKKR